MKCIDFTFNDPASNLALDEILLDQVESGEADGFLRFWESERYFVVVGHGNHVRVEVRVSRCEDLNIPIYRRITGGGTVLQGPGCINFALIMPINRRGEFLSVPSTNSAIMRAHADALGTLLNQTVRVDGFTDLVLGDRKISGNAQRRRQKSFLFHGTFLIDMELAMVDQTLRMPSIEPDYRLSRPHHSFLTSVVGLTRGKLRDTLRACWKAHESALPTEADFNEVHRLVDEKYSRREWNFKFN